MNNTSDRGEDGWAALYAAGALPADEQLRVEHRLEHDPAAVSELREFEPVIEWLAGSQTPCPPPSGVKEALLRRVALDSAVSAAFAPSPQVWKQWPSTSQPDDLFINREDGQSWIETGAAGVRVRQLFVDRTQNRMTALIRMAAGSSYPSHVHDGPEECLVLEGELEVGDTILHAGDYQRAPQGSRHGVQSTKSGCLLLVTSSLSDELL